MLDVQADLMRHFNTRVVIPLMKLNEAPTPAARLNPELEIEGVAYVMVTQYLAAVPLKDLGKPLANLADRRDDIVAALDLLLQGF